jgi:peroxiredoxin Q/BCP
MIEIGKKAPEFCLSSAQKENICLKANKDKWVVLFFYPKDNTSG